MSIKTLVAWAEQAGKDLEAKEGNWVAIAVQWAQEKGWDWWENPQSPYNVGNLYDGNGSYRTFSDLNSGVIAYINFLTKDDIKGYYREILNNLRTGSVDSTLQAMSKSPYCDPPYPMAELSGVLAVLIQKYEAEYGHSPVGFEKPEPKKPPSEPPKPEKPTQASPVEEWVDVTPWPSKLSTLWGIAQYRFGDANGYRWKELLPLNPHLRLPLHVGDHIRVR